MTRYHATPNGNVQFTPQEEAEWDAKEAEYAAGADDRAAAEVRTERDVKLAETDWTQVADAPVDKEEWATYRQALRDVPSQDEFPVTIVWPQNPVESVEETAEESVEETVEETAEESVEESVEESAEEINEESAEESAE